MEKHDNQKLSQFLSWAMTSEVRALDVSELAGGVHTNLVVRCEIDGANDVCLVRMMPPEDSFGFARTQVSAYDLGKEHAVLTDLQRSNIRVPKVWLLDEKGDFLGQPAYPMEYIQGETVLQIAQRAHDEIDREFTQTIISMNQIGPEQIPQLVGKTGPPAGKPADLLGWLRNQIAKKEVPSEFQNGLAFLEAEQPGQRPLPRFGNGDLNPMNFIRTEAGEIAVIDWEYAGFNDPIAEIMLLHTWPEDEPFLNKHPVDRIYCELTGVPVTILKWYEVLSAISGWIYAVNDKNGKRMELHADHFNRCFN